MDNPNSPNSRTGIQKRITPHLEMAREHIAQAVKNELKGHEGDSDYQRRLARAVGCMIGEALVASGISLGAVGRGLNGVGDSIHVDFVQSGKIAAPVEEPEESDVEDEIEEPESEELSDDTKAAILAAAPWLKS